MRYDVKDIADGFYCGALPLAKKRKLCLIWRYYDKISDRLKAEERTLLQEGKVLWEAAFTAELFRPSSFLSKIPKDPTWQSAHIPVPLVYKKDES